MPVSTARAGRPCNRTRASWPDLCSGSRFRPLLGGAELRLPLPEALLGPAATPIPRDRRVGGAHAALLADVGTQVLHHGLRLAVDEHVRLAVEPLGRADGRDER